MKTSLLHPTLIAAMLLVSGLSASAAEAPSQAMVVKISGSPQAILVPGGSPVTLKVGDALPPGAEIKTGPGSEVYFSPVGGAVTAVSQNSDITIQELSSDTDTTGVVKKQKVRLKLDSGVAVATLDPDKKNVNDYEISTPKGIAAARGTNFSASVTAADGTIITANADSVSFTQNGVTVVISQGQVSYTPIGGITTTVALTSVAAQSNPAIANAISSGVTAMASVLSGNLGSLSADSAANLAAKVTASACAAIPTQAASLTSQMVTAVAASPVLSGQASSNVIAAVITGASVAAPTQVAAIAAAAVSGLSTSAATSGATAAATTNAVAAVVTTAVSVDPGEASAISTAVTNATPSQATNVVVGLNNAASSGAITQTQASTAVTATAASSGGQSVQALNNQAAAAQSSSTSPSAAVISTSQGNAATNGGATAGSGATGVVAPPIPPTTTNQPASPN